MKRYATLILPALATLAFVGCQPKEPAEAPDDAAPAAEEPAEPEEPEPTEAAPTEEEKDTFSVRDIVSSDGNSFVLDFNASAIGKETDERCREEGGDDMKKVVDCRRKVSDRLGMPLLRFAQDGEPGEGGDWYWYTYERQGSNLKLYRKVKFTFGEEAPGQLTLTLEGRDLGSRPKPVPKELVVKMPDPNTLEIDDPKHGTMVYRVRVGIFEEGKPIQ